MLYFTYVMNTESQFRLLCTNTYNRFVCLQFLLSKAEWHCITWTKHLHTVSYFNIHCKTCWYNCLTIFYSFWGELNSAWNAWKHSFVCYSLWIISVGVQQYIFALGSPTQWFPKWSKEGNHLLSIIPCISNTMTECMTISVMGLMRFIHFL